MMNLRRVLLAALLVAGCSRLDEILGPPEPPVTGLEVTRDTINFGDSVGVIVNLPAHVTALLVPPDKEYASGPAPLTDTTYLRPQNTTTYLLIAQDTLGATSHSAETVVVLGPGATVLPPTVSITASSSSISAGDSVTITVTMKDATKAILMPNGIEIPGGGLGTERDTTIRVAPKQTTTYLAIAEGPGGTAHAATTVEVMNGTPLPPPTANLTATPETLPQAGGTATLTATVTDADSAVILPGRIAVPLDDNGSATDAPFDVTVTHTTTYMLVAYGAGANAFDVATVQVTGPTPERPTATLTADRDTIELGESVTLTVTSTLADEGLLVPPGTSILNGTVTDEPARTTTYLFAVSGPGGTAFSAVTVVVTPPAPPTADFTTSASTIQQGDQATLTLTVRNATRVLLLPQGEQIAVTQSPLTIERTVTPGDTTTYVAIVDGPGGTTHATVTVNVEGDVPGVTPTASLVADPELIAVGQSATLTVNVTNAASAVLLPLGTDIVLTGGTATDVVIPVQPGQTTTYLLVAYGADGTAAFDVATVAVEIPTDTIISPITRPEASLIVNGGIGPVTINPGESATLMATIEHADSALLLPPDTNLTGNGGVRTMHAVIVTPAQTTTYLLVATGPGGSAFSAVTVIVAEVPPPTVVEFSTSATTVEHGDSVTLTLTVENATSVLLLPQGESIEVTQSPFTIERTVAPSDTTTYIALVEGPGGVTHRTVTVNVRNPPVSTTPTATLTADKNVITTAGEDVTLTVTVENADSARLLPIDVFIDGNGGAPTTRTFTVNPTHTTTYLLIVYGPGTTSYAVTTVQLPGAGIRPTASITASQDTVDAGDTVILTVASTNADRGLLVPPGMSILNGSVTHEPTHTTTYLFAVDGAGGSAHAAVTVFVRQPVVPAPTVTVTAPDVANAGDSVMIRIEATDADQIIVLPPGIVIPGGGLGSSIDTIITVAVNETTSFLFIAEGEGGTTHVVHEITVPGTGVTPTATLTANPSVVANGGDPSVLTIGVTNAVSAVLLPSGQNIVLVNGAANTTVTVNPQHTTSYLLVAQGVNQTAYAIATVQVDTAGTGPTVTRPEAALTAAPDSIQAGESVTLTATFAHADSALLVPSGQNLMGGGVGDTTTTMVTVAPTQTTTYLLIAVGPGGTAFSTATVTVTPPPAPDPPTVTVTGPNTANAGDTVMVRIEVTDADNVIVLPPGITIPGGGIGSSLDTTITLVVDETTSILVIAEGEGGTTHVVKTIAVDGPTSATTATLTADPTVVANAGDASVLTIGVTNAVSAVLLPSGQNISLDATGAANTTVTVNPQHTTSYLLVAQGVNQTAYAIATVQVDTAGIGPTVPRPEAALTAAPDSIQAGESVTLTATFAHADSALLVPSGQTFIGGGVGDTTTMMVTVAPTQTTTYLLIAVGPRGTAFSTATVTVTPPPAPAPPTVTVTGPDMANAGDTVMVRIEVTDADKVIVLPPGITIPGGGVGSSLDTTITLVVDETTSILVIAEGEGGTTHVVKTIAVDGPTTPLTADLDATPDTLPQGGGTVTLTVNVTGADSAIILPTRTVVPLDASGSATNVQFTETVDHTTTFLLVAYGQGTAAFDVATVQVTGTPTPRPTASLTASRDTIMPGESVTLTATIEHADSALLLPPDTNLTGQGGALTTHAVTVSPEQTQTYLLVAVGPGGSAFSAVRVVVDSGTPDITATLVADPDTIMVGEQATITVTSTGADSGTVTAVVPGRPDSVVSRILNGQFQVVPDTTTIYVFMVWGQAGTVTVSDTVFVIHTPPSGIVRDTVTFDSTDVFMPGSVVDDDDGPCCTGPTKRILLDSLDLPQELANRVGRTVIVDSLIDVYLEIARTGDSAMAPGELPQRDEAFLLGTFDPTIAGSSDTPDWISDVGAACPVVEDNPAHTDEQPVFVRVGSLDLQESQDVQAGFVAWHAIEDPLNCYTPNNVVGGVWESPNSVKFIRLRFVFWREN